MVAAAGKWRGARARHSRPLEDAPEGAAQQEAELLREEDPGDLGQRAVRLAAEVQQRGPQEGNAQAEAEEDAPVGERGLQVAAEQPRHPAVAAHDSAGCSQRAQGRVRRSTGGRAGGGEERRGAPSGCPALGQRAQGRPAVGGAVDARVPSRGPPCLAPPCLESPGGPGWNPPGHDPPASAKRSTNPARLPFLLET